MDWILFLHIFTVVNKVLLFPLYFFRKNNSRANRMLACLILLPAFPIIANYIFYTRSVEDFPHFLFASQILFSFFGPIYLFYCMEMLGKSFTFTLSKLGHALPSFCLLILWLIYIFSSPESQLEFAQSLTKYDDVTWQMILSCWMPIVLVLIYISIAAVIVFRHFKTFKEVFTHLENFKMGYITEFIIVMIVQILLLVSISLFTSMWYIELVWVPIFGNLMYFYVVYKSYNYGVIFSETDYQNFKKLYAPLNQYIANHAKQRYATSALSDEKIEEYATLLREGFKIHKWYLNPELNLTVLAGNTAIPSHVLSQVINQKFEKNFFDFVNSYRVEALKAHLLDKQYDHIKIEEIAFICGFNSKAAFQRAFKKHTGTTPTLYRRLMESEMHNIA